MVNSLPAKALGQPPKNNLRMWGAESDIFYSLGKGGPRFGLNSWTATGPTTTPSLVMTINRAADKAVAEPRNRSRCQNIQNTYTRKSGS